VKAFASLLDGLVFAPQRSAKMRLLETYVRTTSDPDRGYGLATLAGTLSFRHAKPAVVRSVVMSRVDPELFALSYDFVGDLAETAALIWPARPQTATPPPTLSQVILALNGADRDAVAAWLEGWMDGLDASGRYALIKVVTGALRVGVSARLVKATLAAYGGVGIDAVEDVWHGQVPPYTAVFAWLEGRADAPAPHRRLSFRPPMLATAIDEASLRTLAPADFAAEWKWDGIRVQLAAGGGECCLFSRSGDDIGASFPEVIERAAFDAVVDGELLVVRDGAVAPFQDLQQRLGRASVTATVRQRHPVMVRVYDLLFEGDADLRTLPFADRRSRLEAWYDRVRPPGIDLSPLVAFAGWPDLARRRNDAASLGIEGLMLKRWDSLYVSGRPMGPWFKWKRDPLTADCVLMYAQRGHGKRSSFYSDYTFGCWRRGSDGRRELVPVGKAYFGFTDAELAELDRWIRSHTRQRFGPVRAVAPDLVLEIAFDAIHPSKRHKSGLAMRFPRVQRIRWDKPATEADAVETLHALVGVARAGAVAL
jgi:DNA ligase-1